MKKNKSKTLDCPFKVDLEKSFDSPGYDTQGDWLCAVSYPGEINNNSNNSAKS